MLLKMLRKNAVLCATAVVMTAGFSGCGLVDDVQLNGKIFDAVGLNSTGSVKKEAKIAERSPLVVPPGLDKLPEPGANGLAQAGGVAGIVDHDAKRQISKADLEKQQADYCKVHYEQAKAHGDNNADLAEGPMGPCRASVMTSMKKWTGDSDEAQ
jgi:hypothetical protein